MRNQDRRTSQRIRKNRCASGRCTNKREFRATSRIRRELSLRTRLLQSRQTSRQQLRKLNLNTLDISFTTTWTLFSQNPHISSFQSSWHIHSRRSRPHPGKGKYPTPDSTPSSERDASAQREPDRLEPLPVSLTDPPPRTGAPSPYSTLAGLLPAQTTPPTGLYDPCGPLRDVSTRRTESGSNQKTATRASRATQHPPKQRTTSPKNQRLSNTR